MTAAAPYSLFPKALLLALVAVAALYDIRFRRIPNWLTVSGAVLGFASNALLLQFHGAVIAASGLALAMAVYVPLYLLRAMGAGDVKLMAAIGAIVGPTSWISIFLAAAIVGGIAALGLILIRGKIYETLFRVQIILTELAHLRAPYRSEPTLDVREKAALRMPHGVSIALGTLLATFALGSMHMNEFFVTKATGVDPTARYALRAGSYHRNSRTAVADLPLESIAALRFEKGE